MRSYRKLVVHRITIMDGKYRDSEKSKVRIAPVTCFIVILHSFPENRFRMLTNRMSHMHSSCRAKLGISMSYKVPKGFLLSIPQYN